MHRIIPLIVSVIVVISCERVVDLELNEADPILVVDAWISREALPQEIRLTLTRDYYDRTTPPGVREAEVSITDENGKAYEFVELDSGIYRWQPLNEIDTFGEIGLAYFLEISFEGNNYSSVSIMTDAPKIDSITFRFEEGVFGFPDSYFGEFWARDLEGPDDAYWIKSWKNGQYLGRPSEINIAYDGAFSRGGGGDGLLFIQPIRDGVNPFDQEDGDFKPPFMIYLPEKNDTIDFHYEVSDTLQNDSLYVEIHSISPEAFFFLNQVISETSREGGFGELFATPMANVITNIESESQDVRVVGFFNTGTRTSLGRRISFDAIREVR